jgi:transcriptional regulator with XRE-family HTH domain
MNKTAEKIHLARVKRNMSAKDLGKKCGVTASYIEQVESGKKIINETIATRILEALGEDRSIISQEATAKKSEVVQRAKPKAKVKVTHETVEFSPSWSGALDNVIRHYPIINAYTKKKVGEKVLATLDTKIEGYHCDKIALIEVFDTSMESYNIFEKDLLTIFLTTDITNDKFYYVEYENKPFIRKLRKEANKKVSFYSSNQTEVVSLEKLKVIGKIIKLERKLD